MKGATAEEPLIPDETTAAHELPTAEPDRSPDRQHRQCRKFLRESAVPNRIQCVTTDRLRNISNTSAVWNGESRKPVSLVPKRDIEGKWFFQPLFINHENHESHENKS